MKLGEKILATAKKTLFLSLMALLTVLVMPISVYADMHALNFHVYPSGCGITSPANDYINVSSDTGAQVAISVTPNPGYSFYTWHVAWKNNSDEDYYAQAVTMGCSGATDAYAYLVNNSDTGIVVRSADDDMGTVVGTRSWSWSYDGQYFTISATPKDPLKYEFDYWELEGKRLDCGATVEVKMPTISGYDKETCSVSDASQDIYTAHFKTKGSDHGFRAVVDNLSAGHITNGSYVPYTTWSSGGTVKATAVPAAGYEFDCWVMPNGLTDAGAGSDKENEIEVPYPSPAPDLTQDWILTAKFKKLETVGILATSYNSDTGKTGGGSVNPSYVGWTPRKSGQPVQSITFTASPDKGMEFVEWDIPSDLNPGATLDLANPSISLVMPESKPASDLIITAKFKTDTKFEVYTEVAATQGELIVPGLGGTVNPAVINPDSSVVTEVILVAEPHDGFEFDRWEIIDKADDTVSSKPGINFTTDTTKPKITLSVPKADGLARDAHVRAIFKYALDDGIWVLAREGGEASPRYTRWNDQTKGTSFSITATPNPGYEFDHWMYHNQQTGMKVDEYSKSQTLAVRMPEEQITKDIVYTAVFRRNNAKAKNKQIHVTGHETEVTKESFLNKWRTWVDPALKFVRKTVQAMAGVHTSGDRSVYESNKASGYDSGKAAAGLKSNIDKDERLTHSQSLDNSIIQTSGVFSVTEVTGIKTVFADGVAGISDSDAETEVSSKYGDLYSSEIVLQGDIYFENEKGERITAKPAETGNDATVVINGIDTEGTDIWMLLYKDSEGNDFTITPISDVASMVRFTLPDRSGGRIALISIKYK